MSRRLKFIAAFLLSLLILTAGYFLYMEEQGNFHAVAAMWKVIVDREPKSEAEK